MDVWAALSALNRRGAVVTFCLPAPGGCLVVFHYTRGLVRFVRYHSLYPYPKMRQIGQRKMVEELQTPRQLAFEEVADKIRGMLTHKKEVRLKDELITHLKSEARIEDY
jgi:hypothetical protein